MLGQKNPKNNLFGFSCNAPVPVSGIRIRLTGTSAGEKTGKMIRFLALWIAAAFSASPLPVGAFEIHVARDGKDNNPGTRRAPFASLERAREEVRSLRTNTAVTGKVTVWVHRGEYPLKRTFELGQPDSGQADKPVSYRAVPGDEVRLVGGVILPVKLFRPVEQSDVIQRIDPEARNHVLVVSLKSVGITNYGLFPDQFSGAASVPELFFNDQRMTLARWPNEGWAEFSKVIESGPAPWRNHVSDKPGAFVYEGERPARWLSAPAVWLQGYWCFDWSSETIRVETIDTNAHAITLAKQHHYGLGSGNRGPRRFFAVNLLEELDQPGEYLIDRGSGELFFWPPGSMERAHVVLSTLTSPVIVARDVSHVVFQGLTIECCAGNGMEIKGGQHNSILGCRVCNSGMDGIVVEGGSHHRVQGCDIFDTGTAGLKISGGDRPSLTPSGHEAVNNHIYNVSRRQRTHAYHVHLGGVGVRLAHNLLHDGPHQAIGLAGNDHLIEFNEIHHTGMETDDCGAFYMGRDPSERGSVLRYNFWHDIGSTRSHGSCAVYFDDGAGGQTVLGNVFYRAAGGSFGAVFSHGGHDNTVRNCIFVECPLALGSAPWNDKGWNEWLAGSLWQQRLLKDVDITRPLYLDRYPDLNGFMQPGQPRRNHAAANLIVKCRGVKTGNWDLTNSVVINTDPGFVNPAGLNFRLKRESVAFRNIAGFEPIPFEKIGLETDEFRRGKPGRNK
jgi:hypothetical protein